METVFAVFEFIVIVYQFVGFHSGSVFFGINLEEYSVNGNSANERCEILDIKFEIQDFAFREE